MATVSLLVGRALAKMLNRQSDILLLSRQRVTVMDVRAQPRKPAGVSGGGQYASGKAGTPAITEHGGYTKLTREAQIDHAVAKAVASGEDAGKARQREEFLNTPDTEIWLGANGSTISFGRKTGLNDASKKETIDAINEVQAKNPHRLGPVDVKVLNPKLMESLAGSKVYGFAVAGSGTVYLSSHVAGPTVRKAFKQEDGFNPGAGKISPVKYTIVHEYGHAKDVARSKPRSAATQDALDTHASPSRYGRTKQTEAFAEAFTEHHFANGGPTSPLATALALSEGWK